MSLLEAFVYISDEVSDIVFQTFDAFVSPTTLLD